MYRLIAMVIALVLTVPLAASATGLAYDHEWQIEGLYVGDAGATRRRVKTDEVSLSFSEGDYAGRVRLADVLAIQEASGFTQSQDASLTLTLQGSPAGGGTAIAGTFSGLAELRMREAVSLDDALSSASGGAVATYDVSGFWAATLDGDVAEGQLVYQSARRRAGSRGPDRDADWFNRASEEGVDATGQPQPFTVAVVGLDPAAGGDGGVQDGVGAGNGAGRPGFFDYVGRGARGQEVGRPVTVSAAQAAAASALKGVRPVGGTPLPEGALGIDSDVSGAYLDAKNRATGLLGEGMVPVGAIAEEGERAARAIRQAGGAGEQSGQTNLPTAYRKLLQQRLTDAREFEGAERLLGDVERVPTDADAGTVAQLRAWIAVVDALQAPLPEGASLVPTARKAASEVAAAEVPREGPLAGALLAAADDPSTPLEARAVARFARAASEDASVGAVVIAGLEPPPATVVWDGGASSVAPTSWRAYRRADGALFWLAEPGGEVALTDATLDGWAWTIRRAALVDAKRVGRVYEHYQGR